MKKIGLWFLFGAIVGIPLTILFGPVGAAITIFIIAFIVSASKK